jgi:predicted ATPase
MHPEGSPLALRPEDLRVLYFEPQPDGYTKVKNIRVSTQGDFIDRWPRGFFEERSKELFDE